MTILDGYSMIPAKALDKYFLTIIFFCYTFWLIYKKGGQTSPPFYIEGSNMYSLPTAGPSFIVHLIVVAAVYVAGIFVRATRSLRSNA